MNFNVRNIDPKMWARVKARAARERVSINATVLRLLRAWAAGRK